MIKQGSCVYMNGRSIGYVVPTPEYFVECEGYQVITNTRGDQWYFVRIIRPVEGGRKMSVEVREVCTAVRRIIDGRDSLIGIPGVKLAGTGRVYASQVV